MMDPANYSNLANLPWLLLLGIVSAGFALGLLFFGILWLTTGKILHSEHPMAWLLGGFVLRMALVLPALYWLTDARWQNLLTCLLGFMLARFVVIRLTARGRQVSHAS